MRILDRFYNLIVVATLIVIGGCSSSHLNSRSTSVIDTTTKPISTAAAVHSISDVRFSIYLKVTASSDHPADELFIDTSGEMRFNTHQQLKSGTWKTPEGFAYVEVPDEDTLLYFMRHASFFEIDSRDILPECPGGDQLYIAVYRADLKKNVRYNTNMCATVYNLLTGEQRKLFPMFLEFMERLRNRYRPRFPD